MKTNNYTKSTRLNLPGLLGCQTVKALTSLALLLALCVGGVKQNLWCGIKDSLTLWRREAFRLRGAARLACVLVTLGCFVFAASVYAQTPDIGRAGSSSKVPTPGTKKLLGTLPKQNTAIYLGWKGYIDTQLDFSKFFDSDHTIMGWFLPQYPHGYEGPIFAENGSGAYLIGQDDYRSGDGGFKDEGSSVLFIQIGANKVLYLVPEFKANTWQHITVVRQNNKFMLYLNGSHKTPVKVTDAKNNTTVPDTEIEVSGSFTSKPSGTLRFGRRTSGSSTSKRDWQTYGLLDDVAVFQKALSAAEINALKNKKRLTGLEKDLIAGWCFDKPVSKESPLPPLLSFWRKDSTRTYKVPISSDRKSVADSQAFDNPLIIGETQVALKLPFYAGEVWQVVQGYGAVGGSHNGSAVFSYDFGFHKNADYGPYHPAGAGNVPFLASVSGKAVGYVKDSAKTGLEINRITLKHAAEEYITYLHLAKKSLPTVVKGGTCEPDTEYCLIAEAGAPHFPQGSVIGEIGPIARHLHLAGRSGLTDGTVIPVAFTDYRASDDGGKTWVHVLRGHPKAGQLIKREPAEACDKIANGIAALKKAKQSLAEQLKSAAPGQKSFFAEQVKEVHAKIQAKEKELEVCLRK